MYRDTDRSPMMTTRTEATRRNGQKKEEEEGNYDKIREEERKIRWNAARLHFQMSTDARCCCCCRELVPERIKRYLLNRE